METERAPGRMEERRIKARYSLERVFSSAKRARRLASLGLNSVMISHLNIMGYEL